jgi:uncharacterized protein (DUF488 family)
VIIVRGKPGLLSQGNKVIYSLGTSIREKKQFKKLLKEFHLETIVDVRRFPKSRFDYFCKDKLCSMLKQDKIGYVYLGDVLGGFRKNGYQEYTKTESFVIGIDELKKVALKKKTAFMCAERFPWKCHRRFIARELEKEGWKVIHIIDGGKTWETKPQNKTQRKKEKNKSLSLPI